MGTPSAQSEVAISHADQDQDSRSDLSSVLSVELNVGPNTNNQDPTRDSTLTGTTSYKFNFPDRNLDSVGDESHSDGS